MTGALSPYSTKKTIQFTSDRYKDISKTEEHLLRAFNER